MPAPLTPERLELYRIALEHLRSEVGFNCKLVARVVLVVEALVVAALSVWGVSPEAGLTLLLATAWATFALVRAHRVGREARAHLDELTRALRAL